MRFTDTFIRRPVFATSISLLIALLGFFSLLNISFREYPKMTNTVINVSTSYYGASAKLMQGFVTRPLEQAIAQADNIDYMTSQSKVGTSNIKVQMKMNTNPDKALAEILSKVNSVRSKLPSDVQDPVLTSSTGATTSLVYIAFTSASMTSSQITDFLKRVVQPQILTTEGVAKANLYGGSEFALRIWLNPVKMAAYGLTATEVITALKNNNLQAVAGKTNNYFVRYNATVNTQVDDPRQLKALVIKTNSDGSVLRLRDIATTSLTKSRDVVRAYADGKNAVILAIDPVPGANPLTVIERVKNKLPDINVNLPAAVHMKILYDSTEAIQESIHEVIKTILEAAIIVILVIMLFMGSIRAALIPVVTIPLSLIGVIIVMQFFGFTLNLLTLLAMVLAIGLVVDDAIVVVENVDRHIKNGASPFNAAIQGTREIAVPVISMTITLCAVYSPIALTGGITGTLFKEFALTLAGTVFISGIIALTLSPMMCSVLVKPHVNPNRFETKVSDVLHYISNAYARSLENVMKNRQVVLSFAVLTFILLPFIFRLIPSELAPSEDKGAFMLIGNAPMNANLDYVQQGMRETANTLKNVPDITSTIAFSGIPDANQGLAVAMLKPLSRREENQKAIIKDASEKLKENTKMAVSAFPMPELPGSSGGLPVQFVVKTSSEFSKLFVVASDVLKEVENNPMFIFSRLDLDFGSATMHIHVNRGKAGAYGITMKQISDTLSTMMGDGYVSRVSMDGRAYEVIPQVERKYRFSPDALENYYVKSSDGKMLPLGSLVSIKISGEPGALSHFNQMNAATIGMVPSPGYTTGQAVSFLKGHVIPKLPKGYQYSFLGESRQFVKEGNTLSLIFFLALFIIYLVLASQFESFRDPFVILVCVPMAVSGALVFMAWGLATMNIYTQIGMVTLVGLIARHGILICEVAREQQLAGNKNKYESVIYAANLRLRAILMTTVSMLAGLAPLLFAKGPGAVSRFDIGLVIMTGLGIGTLFTLYVLPVVYSYIASDHKPLPTVTGAIEKNCPEKVSE